MSMQRLFRDQEARLVRGRAQTGRLKTCSFCGQAGHNKRGCPALQGPEPVAQPPPPPRQKSQQKCLLCGQHGHNRRTCPQRNTEQPPVPEPKRRPRCSACGGVGHQRRTCPTLHAAQPTNAHGRVSFVPAQPSPTQVTARAASPTPPPLPESTDAMVDAAVAAVVAAWRSGVTRQRVELLLPAPREHNKWNPWPGGMRQQLAATVPLVERLLRGVREAVPELGGRIMSELADEVDCVATWQSDKLAAVVFPTADALPLVRQLATECADAPRLLLLINPQWSRGGQLVSDFGFGQQRRDAERFLASFADCYMLQQLEVLGDEVLLLRAWPHPWRAFLLGGDVPRVVACSEGRPGYSQLLEVLKCLPSTRASMTWVDRMLSFRRSMAANRAFDGEHPLLAFARLQDAAPPHVGDAAAAAAAAASPAVQFAGGATMAFVDDNRAIEGVLSRGSASGANKGKALLYTQDSALLLPERQRMEGGQTGQAGVDRVEPPVSSTVSAVESTRRAAGKVAVDRFGELDIITGHPVRDLKLDPVRQLVQWTGPLFGGGDEGASQ